MASWEEIRNGIFAGESGGDYNALFGYANRPGGQFSNVQVSDMSVNDVMRFTDPSGPYAQTVKGQIGRVATPVGAYQIVGKTLRGAAKALGLTGNERFDRATQDALGQYILSTQGTGAWEGYRGPQSQAPQGGTPMMGLLSTGMPEQPQTFGQRLKSGFQDGSLFDSMAMAFNGLRMNPDQNLGEMVGMRQEARQQEDVMNRTVAWLQSMGTPQALQAAEALATGSIDAGSAVQYALAKPEDNRTALQQNIEYFMGQGMTMADAMKAVQGASGGTSISLGSNGIEYGDAPKDKCDLYLRPDPRIEELERELARISAEMGLPPTIGPAPGTLKRLLDDGRKAVARIAELEAQLAAAQAEALALREALTQIADPNAFIHGGSSAELARKYEQIAHAAMDAAKGEA